MRDREYWLLSLLIVLVLALEPIAKGYERGPTSVRFNLYRGYLIVARGSAGPLKDLNFLLDTGASPTVLDLRLAQALHLVELPGVLAGLNGRVETKRAIAPTLQFGPSKRDNFPVLVEDLSSLGRALPIRIDAVVGLDVVGQGAFEIDYSSHEITFGPISSLKNSLPLRMRGGLPLVDAELNQTSMQLLLDTGASSLILFGPKMLESVSTPETSAVQHSTNMIGEFERKQVWLRTLRLGRTEFRQESAFLAQASEEGTEGFDGLVNPPLLGITKVGIDLDHGVVAFSP